MNYSFSTLHNAHNMGLQMPDNALKDRKAVVTAVNSGEFLKPCPGTTRGYYCCGYKVLTPLTGCGMYCAYCILQVYFEQQCQVLYKNFGDLKSEIKQKLNSSTGTLRIGTGEFADSLYLENEYGLSRKIAGLLSPYPNVLTEFKTKSSNVAALKEIENPKKVVVGFSMNTPRMINAFEFDTASLEDRLNAAALCEKMGFRVAFHFDPMIYYPEWEHEYRSVVQSIFGSIQNPDKIAWISLGGFRTMPVLKKLHFNNPAYRSLFCGEMVLGEDRKLRYFRPIRVEFYQAMKEEIEKYSPRATLYLCMESPEVWKDCGLITRIPKGLVHYLDRRAEEMLY
ncbi:MAG: radical SAM protein [Chitinivibrionales bacterium]|nr:radical SAM protein [Chitinivibrionales bacterium]